MDGRLAAAKLWLVFSSGRLARRVILGGWVLGACTQVTYTEFSVDSVEPAEIDLADARTLAIRGRFPPAVSVSYSRGHSRVEPYRVRVGTHLLEDVELIAPDELRGRLLPGALPAGVFDVEVENLRGESRALRAALRIVDRWEEPSEDNENQNINDSLRPGVCASECVDRCVVRCADGQCPVCDGGCTCEFACLDVDGCDAECVGGSTCELRVRDGDEAEGVATASTLLLDCYDTEDCHARCENGSYCDADCRDAERCGLRCDESTCELRCRDAESCEIDCGLDSACLCETRGDARCRLLNCEPVECGDGVVVCNRECP